MGEVVVNLGDWVLFRNSRYERVAVELRQAAKVTPALIKFEGTLHPRQCNRIAVVAAYPDKARAEQVRDAIGGVAGEFSRRRRVIEDERSEKITAALAKANRAVERIIARSALSLAEGGERG